jgi:hypothetical protein
MTLMLATTDGEFRTIADAACGVLALLVGYNDGMTALLVMGTGQDRKAFMLAQVHEWALVTLEDRQQVLDLGVPVVRYDPASRRKKGHEAQPGDLVWADGSFGFRAAGGYRSGMSSWETPVAWLDGRVSIHQHSYEHLAFSRWEVGIVRNDEFVTIAATATGASDQAAN